MLKNSLNSELRLKFPMKDLYQSKHSYTSTGHLLQCCIHMYSIQWQEQMCMEELHFQVLEPLLHS